MPALDSILQEKLQLMAARYVKRSLKQTEPLSGVKVKRGSRELISFSGNDYFGLSQHPDVVAASIEATRRYGTGAGASRLVTGNYPLYAELERALASAKGADAACVFGSGYLANLGTIPALVGAGDLILADKFVHACMLDAAKLAGATLMRFAHNNLAHCRMLLEANRADHQHCLIMTETVFSMDGDRAPVSDLAVLAREFDAWLMTDDAHGLGIANATPVDIQMGTLSKATGSYGGYVCGSQLLIEYLASAARSLIYSTGLPPSVIAASIESLRLIKKDAALVQKPLEHAKFFASLLGLKKAQSAIVPVILKESEKAIEASAYLEERGYLVAAIRPPTVPEHTARLRFAFSALHEASDIEAVASIIKERQWLSESSA